MSGCEEKLIRAEQEIALLKIQHETFKMDVQKILDERLGIIKDLRTRFAKFRCDHGWEKCPIKELHLLSVDSYK